MSNEGGRGSIYGLPNLLSWVLAHPPNELRRKEEGNEGEMRITIPAGCYFLLPLILLAGLRRNF